MRITDKKICDEQHSVESASKWKNEKVKQKKKRNLQ